jgi:hypothetical protein
MKWDEGKSLWCEVLMQAVADALNGPRGEALNRERKIQSIVDARNYVTQPNEDCDIVCALAGVNPEALRARMRVLIAGALSAEEIILSSGNSNPHRSARTQKRTVAGPGVASNFRGSVGTGGGRSAQETLNITFLHQVANQ